MKKLRVLLINPQFPYQLTTTMRSVHEAMENKPPLGILSIGTYLKQNTNFEIKLLDNQLENLTNKKLIGYIKKFRPDVIGITVVSFKLYSAYTITKLIKEKFPRVHICWGGPHLSIYPRESLHLPGVDSIILGDGEIPFTKLCQDLANEKKVENTHGLYTLKSEPPPGKKFKGFLCGDLNNLPILDLTLLPYRRYRAFLTQNLMATAITSRGCPHRCIFCKLDFNNVRFLTIEKVLEQVEAYLKLGIQEIEFYDETFNISTSRVIDFARKILEKNLKFKWSFRGRVNSVDMKMLRLAKQTGCQRIQYGVEAGTNRVLSVLQKGTNVQMIKKCFRLTNKANINTVAYFILGNPSETRAEMKQTMKLAKEIKPTFLEYAIFNIAPGTQSYQMALEKKIIERDIWREYASNPGPSMPILTWDTGFSFVELEGFRKKALRSFYLRPVYVLNRLLHINPAEGKQMIRTGFNLFRQLTINN